jgi:hypothetical protein
LNPDLRKSPRLQFLDTGLINNESKTKTPGGKSYLLMNLPYCLGTKLPEYIAYFTENYKIIA